MPSVCAAQEYPSSFGNGANEHCHSWLCRAGTLWRGRVVTEEQAGRRRCRRGGARGRQPGDPPSGPARVLWRGRGRQQRPLLLPTTPPLGAASVASEQPPPPRTYLQECQGEQMRFLPPCPWTQTGEPLTVSAAREERGRRKTAGWSEQQSGGPLV